MNPSLTRSLHRRPLVAAIAVCTSPALQTPNASSAWSPATANASRSAAAACAGSRAAVAASKPACAKGSCGGAGPGCVPGPERAEASAAASARRAVARSDSSSRRLVEAIAACPSRKQRTSTLVSSIAVACVGAERAKRDSSERSRTTVTCASPPASASARSAMSKRALRRFHATPTSTSRKRAGAAPWDTRIDWPGSPLPQLHRPTSRHSGAEQTASRLPQKRGVMPA